MLSPVTKNFLKNFFRNRVSGKKYPFFGSIEMTRRCNSKCFFCPIGSEKDEFVRGEMKTEEIFRVLDQFAELRIIAFSYLGAWAAGITSAEWLTRSFAIFLLIIGFWLLLSKRGGQGVSAS